MNNNDVQLNLMQQSELTSRALTRITEELKSSNLTQDLLLDTVDDYASKLTSSVTAGITTDQTAAVAAVASTVINNISNNANNTTSDNSSNTTSNSLSNTTSNSLSTTTTNTPAGGTSIFITGIQKFYDGLAKLKIDNTALEGILESTKSLSSLTQLVAGIANLSLTKAMIGLVKLKIFAKALGIAFRNIDSPLIAESAENIKKISDSFGSLDKLAKSVDAFASIKWLKALVSVKLLKVFLGSLSKLPLAIIEKMVGVVKKIGDGLPEPLKKISDSIGYFCEKIGKFPGILIKGAIGIAALGLSLLPLVFSVKKFAGIKLETLGALAGALTALGLAGVMLGKNLGAVLKGSLAIVALGLSIIPLAYGLNLMKDVGIGTIGVLAVALTALGVAAAIFGSFAPLIGLGALVIAGLGASLIPLSYALKELATVDADVLTVVASALGTLGFAMLKAAPGLFLGGLALLPFSAGVAALGAAVGLFGGNMITFFDKFATFSAALDPGKLTATAGAIGLLAGAIGAFGAGQAVEGLGNLVGKFLRFGSDSPLEQLQKFANIGEQLATAGTGVLNLSQGIDKLSKLGKEIKSLKEFPIETVQKLSTIISANPVLAAKDTVQPSITTVPPNVGASLNSIGNTATISPTIIVNNGGNTSNVSTSSVNNNGSTMMPIMTASALGY